MNDKKHMKKGVTLIEIVIVLAIISILSLIVGVTWNNMIYRSRLKTANSRAKIIFNAAQAEAIKYAANERTDPSAGYMGSGDFYFYWNGFRGGSFTSDSHNAGDYGSAGNTRDANFATAINRIAGEDGMYKVFVRNYTVQSVVYTPTDGSRYLGAYPNVPDEILPVATPKALNAVMNDFVLT